MNRCVEGFTALCLLFHGSGFAAHSLMNCPTCGKPVAREGNPYRPFCSERCKLIDFGAWLNEEYAVPSEERPPLPDDTAHPEAPADEGGPRRDTY